MTAIKKIQQSPVWRYLITGGFISFLDFVGFTFAKVVLNFDVLSSNILSTTVAMAISYFINRAFVFRSANHKVKSFIKFAIYTALTGFGLQTIVILAIVETSKPFVEVGFAALISLGAKVLAMGVGAIANFFGYRYIFKTRS